MEYFRDQSTIVLFVLLFMPGFVSTRVFDLKVPGHTRDYGKAIYETVGYSFFTYALWSPVLVSLFASHYTPPLWLIFVLALLILIVTPAVLPIAYLNVVRSKTFASKLIDPCPTSWDWALQENETAMILCHLKDGTRIGGTWVNKAFSSSYPVPTDLYLAEVWNVDQDTGRFIDRVQDSKGIVLWGTDIAMVEFFDLEETRRKADVARQQTEQ